MCFLSDVSACNTQLQWVLKEAQGSHVLFLRKPVNDNNYFSVLESTNWWGSACSCYSTSFGRVPPIAQPLIIRQCWHSVPHRRNASQVLPFARRNSLLTRRQDCSWSRWKPCMPAWQGVPPWDGIHPLFPMRSRQTQRYVYRRRGRARPRQAAL